MPNSSLYRGRFAPSTTGQLHLGSLYTAVASFLESRSKGGKWLVRIDDIDHLRNVKGSVDDILKTLEAFGLHWDEAVYYQSQQREHYQAIVDALLQQQHIYPCVCTRKALNALNTQGIYPRFCLQESISLAIPHALRIKTQNCIIRFDDGLQGFQSHNIEQHSGDFIIKRKDNIIAYQLAVVIDDEQQQITDVVRGLDLLDSTPRQLYLQQLLGYSSPQYLHVPIITDEQGHKLSKQTFAQAIDSNNPQATLFYILQLLNQTPPLSLKKSSVAEILEWAITHWQVQRLEKQHTISG